MRFLAFRTVLALAVVVAACAPEPDLPASLRPLGDHRDARVAGVHYPSHSQVELDAATAAYYDTWKRRYLVSGCVAGEYRVNSSSATAAYTVSEGIGYGMLITATVGAHDPEAQAIFDGLYAYFDAHRSRTNTGLMAWAQDEACTDIGTPSASDADLDIAFALLLADKQWLSSGALDYATAARRAIEAILDSDVHPGGSILFGDWVTVTSRYYEGTRLSDAMTGHLRHFAAIDPRAERVLERAFETIEHLQRVHSPNVGLVPDFAIGASGAEPAPASARWFEGDHDGHYGYNACRVPMRLVADYLGSRDPRVRSPVERIAAWIRTTTDADPTKIRDGYALDGAAYGRVPSVPFVATFAVASMLGGDQVWVDELWDELVARPPDEYYGDTLKLLAMIMLSDNWWSP